MKILILGANGQVGWELQRSLAPLGQIFSYDQDQVDLTNDSQISSVIDSVAPDVIANAAAYTAVDKAESDAETAHMVNHTGVELLANEANKRDAWLIHYSTDYVFDGTSSTAYDEEAATNPLSVYGQSKLLGDLAVQESQCKHLIFRTSWVYAAHGVNFAKTMIRLAKEKEELRIIADQIGAPTSAELIADVTALCLYKIAESREQASTFSGIYNLVPAGETSWHGFAKYVIGEAIGLGFKSKVKPDDILPIGTSEYPVAAQRPANSRLNTNKLSSTFNVNMPHWEFHVKRFIQELSLERSL